MKKLFLVLAIAALTGAAQAGQNVEGLARTCNNCHGVGGVSAGSAMPSIGGLPRDYLKRVMKQWKYDERSAITMSRIVKGFSDDEIDALADHFAKLPWVPVPQAAAAEMLAKGKETVAANCTDCHGPNGGDPDVDSPKINGQSPKYMELEMQKYRSADFKMPHRKMKKAVQETPPTDASAAARYFGAQK
ncbi:MAG: c-type cytochrome [Rhodospirillales bacterium]|jgi:sulfide dehydrogenase cytochrome subunit